MFVENSIFFFNEAMVWKDYKNQVRRCEIDVSIVYNVYMCHLRLKAVPFKARNVAPRSKSHVDAKRNNSLSSMKNISKTVHQNQTSKTLHSNQQKGTQKIFLNLQFTASLQNIPIKKLNFFNHMFYTNQFLQPYFLHPPIFFGRNQKRRVLKT